MLLERAGRFDECLGAGTEFPSCEDTDYKLRLESMGVKMRSTPRAIVYHTHGVRYGVRALLAHQRNYARGNGAMAAKLTMSGDPRGAQWLEATRRDCLRSWFQNRRPQRLAADLRRLQCFAGGYRDCIRDYSVDAGLLRPIKQLRAVAEPAAVFR